MSSGITPNGLSTFLISAGTVILLSATVALCQNKRRKSALLAEKRELGEKILSSPDSSWKKVGSVKEILYYPLKSGKGRAVEECHFENYGISVSEEQYFPMRDRMFLVYDERSGKFVTGRQQAKLLLVSVTAAGEGRAKLEVGDLPPLVFDIPDIADNSVKVIKCSMWFGELVKCLDCGSEASAWLSKYLLGTDSGLRLGAWVPDSPRNLTKGSWEQYSKAYRNLRDEDAGLFSDLSSYMIMSESSVNDLNQRLKKPIAPLQLRPNIVVEGSEPYAEDEWEWIKIGKDAIIRNVKLCTRCSMVRIDPDTGIPDPSEPLKTLRTYRKLKNAELDALENHAPSIGINCGLYRSGVVKVGDDISVYRPN